MKKKENVVGYCVFMITILLAGAVVSVVFTGCGKEEEVVAAPEVEEVQEVEVQEEELPEMSGHVPDSDIVTDSDILAIGAGAGSSEEHVADATDVPEDAVLVEFPTEGSQDDPNGLFRVSEEWAKEQGGLYVKIDDNFYSLMNKLPADVIDKYDIGYVVGPEGQDITSDKVAIYLADYSNGLGYDIPSATRNAIVTCGDFSPLQIHRDDPLVIFGDSVGESIYLEKVNFVGYTIPATENGQALNYYPVVNHLLPNNLLKDHIGVFTIDEQPVEDVRNLEYGKEYLYECYLGTEYREIKVIADSKCYVVERDKELFTAEPTKSGYFTIDISSLEPGLYTYNYFVFEIVE